MTSSWIEVLGLSVGLYGTLLDPGGSTHRSSLRAVRDDIIGHFSSGAFGMAFLELSEIPDRRFAPSGMKSP